MTMDNEITFTPTGYVIKQSGTTDAGGQPMKMNNTIEGKHLGACK
jgi:hypothetical protein